MAFGETVGFGKCPSCGGVVAWKVNRSDMAYCRCDHCGAETRDHWLKTTTARLRQLVAPAAGGEEGPAESKPTPKPTPKPAPQKRPQPAPSALSGILGLLGGDE